MFNGLIIANSTALAVGIEAPRTCSFVTIGLFTIFGLNILRKRLKAEKEYARAKKLMWNLKPGQTQKILETGHIGTLSDAYALGWFCHRRQEEADNERAMEIIRNNRLFDEYRPTDDIAKQLRNQKPGEHLRKVFRDYRHLRYMM